MNLNLTQEYTNMRFTNKPQYNPIEFKLNQEWEN